MKARTLIEIRIQINKLAGYYQQREATMILCKSSRWRMRGKMFIEKLLKNKKRRKDLWTSRIETRDKNSKMRPQPMLVLLSKVICSHQIGINMKLAQSSNKLRRQIESQQNGIHQEELLLWKEQLPAEIDGI